MHIPRLKTFKRSIFHNRFFLLAYVFNNLFGVSISIKGQRKKKKRAFTNKYIAESQVYYIYYILIFSAMTF